MDLACALIQKEAGGRVSGDFYDIFYQPLSQEAKIKISMEDLEARLGYKADPERFENWMKRLGCKASALGRGKVFEISAPSYRPDLKIKEDLIEEFARLEGYGKVPENRPSSIGAPKDSDSLFLASQKLKSFLTGRGWLEAVNYSFCDPEFYREILGDRLFLEDFAAEERSRAGGVNLEGAESLDSRAGDKSASAVSRGGGGADSFKKQSFSVNNPISRQLSLMKPLLTPDLIKNIRRNFRHSSRYGRIFELAPVFYKAGGDYRQNPHLALALWGEPIDIWSGKGAKNIYHIKSALESLFKAFGAKGWAWRAPEGEIAFLHPKQSLILSFQNRRAGFLAGLHPRLLKKYKIPLDIALAEISMELLAPALARDIKFKPFSSLPSVERDLCFVIPPSQPVEAVRGELKKSLGPLCASLRIFDIYESAGERSVSFRARLSPQSAPLAEGQISAALDRAVTSAGEKFAIQLKRKSASLTARKQN